MSQSQVRWLPLDASAQAESGQRPTRKRTDTTLDLLWRNISGKVVEHHAHEQERWRVALHGDKACLLCSAGGGLLLRCIQGRCEAEFHPWCLVQSAGLNSEVGLDVMQPDSSVQTHALHAWCARHFEVPVFCVCRKPYDDPSNGADMIACNTCGDWFHYKCVGLPKRSNFSVYYCPRCSRDGNSVTEQEKEKNAAKEAMSVRLTLGVDFAREISFIQEMSTTIDKLVFMQRSMTEKPTQPQVSSVIADIATRLSDWRASLAEAVASAATDGEDDDHNSVWEVLQELGLFDALSEWSDRASDCAAAATEWSTQAQQLVEDTYERIQTAIQKQGFFHALTASDENGLASICAQGHSDCDEFLDKVHEIFLYPNYLGTFEAEIRAITILANGMSKLQTVASETTEREHAEANLRNDVTELQKALDNLLEGMTRPRGGSLASSSGMAVLSTIRAECENLVQPLEQLLGCQKEINDFPKAVSAEAVKRALMHISPDVAALVKQSYTELKLLADKADTFDQAYNLILRSSDLTAAADKLADLRVALEQFPLLVGVEEGVAYLTTCATCTSNANELIAEPRIPFSAVHLLIAQMRQCISASHGKARLLTAVQNELKQHIATFEEIVQTQRPHQAAAASFLNQPGPNSSGGSQSLQDLLSGSGCLELLQSLENSRVIWPEESVLQGVVGVFQDLMNVQELDESGDLLSSHILFDVHDAAQNFLSNSEWSKYAFIQTARAGLADAIRALQSRVNEAHALGQRVSDFLQTCEHGSSPTLEVAEELQAAANELRIDVDGLEKLSSMVDAATTVSTEVEAALQQSVAMSDDLTAAQAHLQQLQAQVKKVPLRADLVNALARRVELISFSNQAKRWAAQLQAPNVDLPTQLTKLPSDEAQQLIELRAKLLALRQLANSSTEQQLCDAAYETAFVVSWRAAAVALLREGGDAQIAEDLLEELDGHGSGIGSTLVEAEPLKNALQKAKNVANGCTAAREDYRTQHQQLEQTTQAQFSATYGPAAASSMDFDWLADVEKLHACLRAMVPSIGPLQARVEALRTQHNEMIVQRIYFHQLAKEINEIVDHFNSFIGELQHATAIASKMKDAFTALQTNKLPPRSEVAVQDVELAEIVNEMRPQQDFSSDLVRFVLCAASSAAHTWVQEAQSLAPQRKTRKSNPATYPHVSGLQRLLHNPICYAVGTTEFTHLFSLLSLFISWEEDYRKFMAPGRDVIMAKRATADSAVDDPFQAVAEAEQLERRVQRIPIRSEEAGILLWAQALFTWVGDVPDLDASTMTWKQAADRMQKHAELQQQLSVAWRAKLAEIEVLDADTSSITFTADANPLFEQARTKSEGLSKEMAKAQQLTERAKALVGDPRSQLAALQDVADHADDSAVQPDFAVMKILYDKLGVAPPAKAADTPTKVSAASAAGGSSRKRRSAHDPDFMPFGDDDHEDEEYVEDDGEIEEDDDEAFEDPELLAQEMAEMRRTSERKRRSTTASSASKRKRPDVQRQGTGESLTAAKQAATRTKASKPAPGKARRCLAEGCRRSATVESWYCSDTCAVNSRQVQLHELLHLKSNLADWWCNSLQSRAMGLDQAAKYFIRSGDAIAYGNSLALTDALISNSLKESGLDLDSLLPDDELPLDLSSKKQKTTDGTDNDENLIGLLNTIGQMLEAADEEAPARVFGWKMDQFCMSLPACAEPLLANVMRPSFDGSKRVLFTAGPAELLSESAQLKSDDFDKTYGPRLTVRQQFEVIFVEAMKDLGRIPDIEGVFLAQELERELYRLFPFNDSRGKEEKQFKQEYRRRYLSLKASLRKNLPLIAEVSSGERPIATLCTMSAQELANPEVQSRRAKEAEEFKRAAIAEQSLAEQLEVARRIAEGKSVSEAFNPGQQTQLSNGAPKFKPQSLPKLETKKRTADKMETESNTSAPTSPAAGGNVSEHDLRLKQAQKRKTNVLDLLTANAPSTPTESKSAAAPTPAGVATAAPAPTPSAGNRALAPASRVADVEVATPPPRLVTAVFAHPGFPSFRGTCGVTDKRLEPLLASEITIVGRMPTVRCTEYVEQAIARGTRLIGMMVVTVSADTCDAYQEFVNLCEEKQRVGVCDLDPRRRDTKMLYVVPYSMKTSFPMLMDNFPTEEGDSKLFGIFVIKDFNPVTSNRR